jgi:hypothetical protein
LRVHLIKPAYTSQSRIVHEDVDLQAASIECAGQLRGGSRLGEIAGDDDRGRTVSLHFGCERLHCRHCARAQHQIVTVFRQLAREIGADAARSSGDQRQRSVWAGHARCSFTALQR